LGQRTFANEFFGGNIRNNVGGIMLSKNKWAFTAGLRVIVALLMFAISTTGGDYLVSTAAADEPASGVVAWWKGEGNANDIAGANNGTVQGNTVYAAGKVGQAFSLDGTNSEVTAPAFDMGV
jgi:hypothetical protein